jgi:hypothetical protein
MALWHLTSHVNTGLLLWRTGPAAFRVMQYDEPAEVLTNADYFLFDKKYETVLRKLPGQVDLRPVTVTDGVRHLVWDHYLELTVHRAVDADAILAHTAAGLDMYRFGNDCVFVSEALKEAFRKVGPDALHFSAGLSEFAA